MEIDEHRVTEAIEGYLQKLIDARGCRGFMLGLSGGIDSAVLASLAVRAAGPGRVRPFFLYDRDSEVETERNAELMANRLGLVLEKRDITPAMRERGVYRPLMVRLSNLSGRLNRSAARFYQWIGRESPFASSLRVDAGEFECGRIKRLCFKHLVRAVKEGFDTRHRYRRELLEDLAEDEGYQLLGAANRSEAMVGWFAKGGIDDLPIQPLLGLYKTQVRQLARFLGVPESIRRRPPSPDMHKGITDELGMQLRYERLDGLLEVMQLQLNDSELRRRGLEPAELRVVEELHRLSACKRTSPHETPPVDGRHGSRFRKDAAASR